MRIKIVLIFISITLNIACNRKLNNNSLCDKRIKEELKILSKAMTFDKNTKVYTLYHSKLPDLNFNEFNRLKDSLESVNYLPIDLNHVKHFLYCKKIKEIIKLNCQVNSDKLQRYFGKASSIGTDNGKIKSLFYLFNFEGRPDCYERYAEFGPYSKCSLLTFVIKNEIVIDVLSESFGY